MTVQTIAYSSANLSVVSTFALINLSASSNLEFGVHYYVQIDAGVIKDASSGDIFAGIRTEISGDDITFFRF